MSENEPQFSDVAAGKKIRSLNYAYFCPIVLGLEIVRRVTEYIFSYDWGYYQKPISPIPLLLMLFGFFILMALLVVWIESLFRKKQRLWTTSAFLALLTLIVLGHAMPSPNDMLRYGMRDGMLRRYGVTEIRQFAKDFDKLPPLPDPLSPFTKCYDNRRAFHQLDGTGLKEKYPFLSECEFIRESGNTICVNWGGVDDHWGFCVTMDGKPSDTGVFWAGSNALHAGDDIYFFHGF